MGDELSGLTYLRARYYNPAIGRFTQEDVIYDDGFNLYAYCGSNPIIYSDPSGLCDDNIEHCKHKIGGDFGGVSGDRSNRLALGLSDYLDDFADNTNAHTWKNFSDPNNWQQGVLDAIYNSDMEIVFNLDGIDSPWKAVMRASSGYGGGATDWELWQIKMAKESWGRVTWYQNGKVVPNPFE